MKPITKRVLSLITTILCFGGSFAIMFYASLVGLALLLSIVGFGFGMWFTFLLETPLHPEEFKRDFKARCLEKMKEYDNDHNKSVEYGIYQKAFRLLMKSPKIPPYRVEVWLNTTLRQWNSFN